MKVKVSGNWREGEAWVKISGNWRKGVAEWVKIGGTWREIPYGVNKITLTTTMVEDRFAALSGDYRYIAKSPTGFTKTPTTYPITEVEPDARKSKRGSTYKAANLVLTFSDSKELQRLSNAFTAGKAKITFKGGFDYVWTKDNAKVGITTADAIQILANDKISFYNLLRSVKDRTLTIIIEYL